jgi:hypothetical protein
MQNSQYLPSYWYELYVSKMYKLIIGGTVLVSLGCLDLTLLLIICNLFAQDSEGVKQVESYNLYIQMHVWLESNF